MIQLPFVEKLRLHLVLFLESKGRSAVVDLLVSLIGICPLYICSIFVLVITINNFLTNSVHWSVSGRLYGAIKGCENKIIIWFEIRL